jgi:hypothetical protein
MKCCWNDFESAIVTSFKIPWNLPEGSDEKHEESQPGWTCASQLMK